MTKYLFIFYIFMSFLALPGFCADLQPFRFELDYQDLEEVYMITDFKNDGTVASFSAYQMNEMVKNGLEITRYGDNLVREKREGESLDIPGRNWGGYSAFDIKYNSKQQKLVLKKDLFLALEKEGDMVASTIQFDTFFQIPPKEFLSQTQASGIRRELNETDKRFYLREYSSYMKKIFENMAEGINLEEVKASANKIEALINKEYFKIIVKGLKLEVKGTSKKALETIKTSYSLKNI